MTGVHGVVVMKDGVISVECCGDYTASEAESLAEELLDAAKQARNIKGGS